jgi:hypothetical protein
LDKDWLFLDWVFSNQALEVVLRHQLLQLFGVKKATIYCQLPKNNNRWSLFGFGAVGAWQSLYDKDWLCRL